MGNIASTIKNLPKLVNQMIELLLLTDDIVAMVAKIFKFTFGTLVDLFMILLENIAKLAEPLLDIMNALTKVLEENKEIPSIVIYGTPIYIGLYLLYYIVSII